MKFRFHAQRSLFQPGISLHMAALGDKHLSVATNITFQKIEEGAAYENPMVVLGIEDAQQLMDELYHVGVRPSQAAGSAGQLDAVKYHLEDMRSLVFQKGGAK